MIKVFQNGKLFREYEECEMKNMNDIIEVFSDLGFQKREVPELVEEPFQHIMRSCNINLQAY